MCFFILMTHSTHEFNLFKDVARGMNSNLCGLKFCSNHEVNGLFLLVVKVVAKIRANNLT